MKKWIVLAVIAGGGYGIWRLYKDPKTKERLMRTVGCLAELEVDLEYTLRRWCDAEGTN